MCVVKAVRNKVLNPNLDKLGWLLYVILEERDRLHKEDKLKGPKKSTFSKVFKIGDESACFYETERVWKEDFEAIMFSYMGVYPKLFREYEIGKDYIYDCIINLSSPQGFISF